ncbi:hypothetical protein [Pseudodesulfovibrio nedwellii]|nr:hypothetical protein [Pseudodesulfovibrio nedwellii]
MSKRRRFSAEFKARVVLDALSMRIDAFGTGQQVQNQSHLPARAHYF